jgi:hypothetical protein
MANLIKKITHMKKQESQSWFLIKEDWSKWLFDLSDEDAGKFIKAIYSGEVPSGVIGVLYQSHYDEFTAVNQKRIDNKNMLSERGASGAKIRWDNHAIKKDSKDMLKHTQALKNDGAEWPTGTATATGTDTVINKIYTIPEEHKKIDEFWDIENFKIK